MRHFWLLWKREEGVTGYLVGKGQGCYQISYNTQDGPPQKINNYVGQNAFSTKVEKLDATFSDE